MSRIRLFLSLVCMASVFSFVSCGTESETQNPRTVVTGQIINGTADTPKTMLWFIGDPFTEDNVSVELSEDGSFRMETQELNVLCNHTFKYGYINFFAAPGDSIHMIIDAAKIRTGDLDAVSFEGDRAAFNNEQVGCNNYMDGIVSSDINNNRLNMDMEPAAMIAQLNERLDMYQDSLTAYEKRQASPLSDSLKDFIRRDATFLLANQLLGYKRDDRKSRLELFSDPLFGVNNPRNFITSMFPYHLNVYMYAKVYSDTTVSSAFKQKDFSMGMSNGIHVLMREPASLARDVMMWKFLSNMIGQMPEIYDSIPEVQAREVFTDSRLDTKLANLVHKLTNVDFPVTPIDGVSYLEPSDSSVIKLPKGDVFAHLAQKYPNKVLYVNVYSSGCGPCLYSMKHSAPALYEAVKGMDVVFVNLCLDSRVEDWRNVVEKYGIRENYWFDNDATSMFRGTYDIAGYPTYILVGKDGRVATMRAESPSHLDAAVEQIEELLAK